MMKLFFETFKSPPWKIFRGDFHELSEFSYFFVDGAGCVDLR